MKSTDSAVALEHDSEASEHTDAQRLARRLARKPVGQSPDRIVLPSPPWTFGNAVNQGIHRSADGGEIGPDAHTAVASAGASAGTSLPTTLQRKFERSLGVDLSGVRVHTGDASAQAAGAVSARAYATGQDIHFGAGQFDPSSKAGEHLLAHEVAHTVQQRGGSHGAQFKLEVTGPGDACEHEADAAADAMVSGHAYEVGGAGAAVARDAALNPEQERILHLVQAQGASLGARDQGTLVGYANTLHEALEQQHGATRQRIARALVRLYDAMEANLRRRFDAGEDVGIAAEITPFSMIDIWTADAGEARRPRPHRRRPPRPPQQVTGGVPGQQPQQTQPPPPPPDVTHAVDGVDMQLPQPHIDDSGHTAHQVATGVEIAHTLIDTVLLSHTVETALAGAALFAAELLAGALAVVGTVVTAAAVLHTGDEFNRAGAESQRRIVHFCSAFSHAARGEPVGSGAGAAQGAQAGRQVHAQLAAAGHNDAAIRQAAGFMDLYLRAWQRVTPGMAQRLAHAGHGAVPNAEGFAHAFIEATLPGHAAYAQYVND